MHLVEDEMDDDKIDMKEENSVTESEDDKEAIRDLYMSDSENSEN